MADQLQEMLQKIYSEGVDKAKTEADIILKNAQEQAEKVKMEAKKEADKLIKEAKQKAEELEKNINSDLKMAAQQALIFIKQKVMHSLLNETINKKSEQMLQDNDFLQKLILEVLSKWSSEQSAILTLPENKQKELETFFKASVPKILAGKIVIDFSPVMKNGITIAPEDATYKLSFTDEDFANFFKAYLRPKAAQILFGE